MAVCRTVDGTCVVDCIDLPSFVREAMREDGRQASVVSEWIIHTVVGRRDVARMVDPVFMKALHDGVYLDARRTEIARFTLPAGRPEGAPMSAPG